MRSILCFLLTLGGAVQVVDTYAATPSIKAGDGYSLAVKDDGTAWAWGGNGYGQLGDGTTTNRNRRVPVISSSMGSVTKISPGGGHSMAITPAGTLWAWGLNERGQLGDGSNIGPRTSPGQVTTYPTNYINNVSSLAAGNGFSLAVKTDGTVLSWGSNIYGELGRGTPSFGTAGDLPTPGLIPGLSGVIDVAAGSHALALKNNGTVWAWGLNNRGQLGDGSTTNRVTPSQVIGLSGIVTAISASGNNSLALRDDGTVWQWGAHVSNHTINLDDPFLVVPTQVSGLTNVVAIAAGTSHSQALKSDGTVWAWGFNLYGEIGDGTTTTRLSPVQVVGLSGVTAIAAGDQHSLALKNDGSIMAWGSNLSGELGLSSPSVVVTNPIPVPLLYLTPPPPPSNDNFTNRITIGGASGTVNGTIAGATLEAGEPTHANSSQTISVWWKWTAPMSGQVTFNTSDSNVAVYVAAYSGITVNALTSVGASVFQVQAGQEYQVATYSYGAFGTVALSWSLNTSPQAGLSIGASISPNPAYSNETIRYDLTVTNSGPQSATNVRVTDTLPPNTTLAYASNQCSLVSNAITCLVGTLVTGYSVNMTIGLRPSTAPQTVNNTIAVASDVPDPNSTNNTVSASVGVLAGIRLSNPDGAEIPTLPEWAAIILALLLMGVAARKQARN